MELTFLCFWEEDGIHFVKAKENVIVFQYYQAASRSLDPLTVTTGGSENSPLAQESGKIFLTESNFEKWVLTLLQSLRHMLAIGNLHAAVTTWDALWNH